MKFSPSNKLDGWFGRRLYVGGSAVESRTMANGNLMLGSESLHS